MLRRIKAQTIEDEKYKERAAMSELLPCPFCAGKPFIGGFPDVEIRCDKCHQAIVKASWYFGDLGTMRAAWNRRQQPTAAQAVSDEMVKAAREAGTSFSAAYHLGLTGWEPEEFYDRTMRAALEAALARGNGE